MARTAQTNLKIQNSGTPLGTGGFNTLNLLGNLSATDGGNGLLELTASGGSAGTNIATQVVTGVQSGSNVTLDLTTLSHVFVAVEVVFRNGQNITPVTSWSLTGSTVTVVNASASEVFQVQYTF